MNGSSNIQLDLLKKKKHILRQIIILVFIVMMFYSCLYIYMGCIVYSFFFIILGLDGASGILFLKFTDRYKQSAALTAWLGSLATALRLSLGILLITNLP